MRKLFYMWGDKTRDIATPETLQHQRHCNTRDIATPVNSPASSDLINHSIDRFHYCTRGTHTGSDPHNYTPTRHQHCSLHCLPHTRKPISDIFSSNKLESTICITHTLMCYANTALLMDSFCYVQNRPHMLWQLQPCNHRNFSLLHTHAALPNPLPSTTLQCAQIADTWHVWQVAQD